MLRTATSGVGRVPSKTSRDNSICQANIKDFADKPVTSGPWGGEGGFSWDDEVHAGIRKIIIRSGTAIDSILIEYDDRGQPKRSVRHGGSGGVETDKVSRLKPVPAGPWGGRGGNPWDDGVHSGIRQIVVGFGTAIDNIKFEYVRNGQFVWSARHGGNGGNKTETVKFDYPNEVLMSVSGHYGHFGQHNVLTVRSLTFHTNRKKYGPFGEEKGTSFASPSTGCKILGFHGRNGWYLDAIGVHLVIEHPIDEATQEEVENAWMEFVSRAIHHNAGAGAI